MQFSKGDEAMFVGRKNKRSIFEDTYANYNKETNATINEARDITSGKVETKSYSSAKELYEELDAE